MSYELSLIVRLWLAIVVSGEAPGMLGDEVALAALAKAALFELWPAVLLPRLGVR